MFYTSDRHKGLRGYKMVAINKLIGRRIVASFILFAFLLTSGIAPVGCAQAQELFQPAVSGVEGLSQPGTRMSLSPAFAPPLLKGIKVYRNDPFRFDFILDKGDAEATDEQVKTDSPRLIKYFLAALTVPEKDLWVNLSPYEKDRIITDVFGQTEMGRTLLSQDYILKQITATLMYPESDTGKKFWARVYQLAYEKFGTTDIPFDAFNKVWITPDKAVVYENNESALIIKSHMKVMLESDYMATRQAAGVAELVSSQEITKAVLREIAIPELEREVNEGKNFAPLRQAYQSFILAAWFKKKIKESLFSQVYVDQKKISGVNINDPAMAQKIWDQYVKTFKKGAYNYIKDEKDTYTGELIPRKYFAGGIGYADFSEIALEITDKAEGVIEQPGLKVIEGGIKPFEAVEGDTPESADKILANEGQVEQLFNASRLKVLLGPWDSQKPEFKQVCQLMGVENVIEVADATGDHTYFLTGGLPNVLKFLLTPESFREHRSDIVEIAKTAGKSTAVFFDDTILFKDDIFQNKSGSEFEKYWTAFVEIVKESDSEAHSVSFELARVNQLYKTPEEMKIVGNVLNRNRKAAKDLDVRAYRVGFNSGWTGRIRTIDELNKYCEDLLWIMSLCGEGDMRISVTQRIYSIGSSFKDLSSAEWRAFYKPIVARQTVASYWIFDEIFNLLLLRKAIRSKEDFVVIGEIIKNRGTAAVDFLQNFIMRGLKDGELLSPVSLV